jgi:N5-(carboxyethyl)ornithine synthase
MVKQGIDRFLAADFTETALLEHVNNFFKADEEVTISIRENNIREFGEKYSNEKYTKIFLELYRNTIHALMIYGHIPDSSTKVAILSPGNVAQGAFAAISKFTTNVEMYYRKTMKEFYDKITEYDIIINGIEIDNTSGHIINKQQLSQVKPFALIIDAAADAGNAIEGTHYTKLDNPIYKENDIFFYEVNNAPTIFYRDASYEISKSFSKYIYSKDVNVFSRLIDEKY